MDGEPDQERSTARAQTPPEKFSASRFTVAAQQAEEREQQIQQRAFLLAGKSDGSVLVAGREGSPPAARKGRSYGTGGQTVGGLDARLAANDSLQAQVLRSCGKALPRKSATAFSAPAAAMAVLPNRRGSEQWCLPKAGEASRAAVGMNVHSSSRELTG